METADELKRKTVQYETGMELAPGKYNIKVVVRENESVYITATHWHRRPSASRCSPASGWWC